MSITNNIITISLSKKSFFKLILFTIITLLLIYIRYLLLTLALAFILASFAKYFAQLLNSKYKFNYKYSLASIFIGLSIIVVVNIYLLFPILIREGYGFFETISLFINKFEMWLNYIGIPSENFKLSQLTNLIPNLGQVTFGLLGVFGQILTYTLLIFVLAFYISVNEKGVNNLVKLFVPNNIKDDIPNIIKKSEYHIGKWAFMEASIAFIVGIFIYIASYILGFKYAFLFSLLAGFGQLIPILGSVFIFSIIIIYAFLQSYLLGIITVILIIFIQSIKKFLLLPVIFSSFKINNNLLIILALMVGGVLAGTLGVIIAMPVVSLSKIIYKDIMSYDKY